MRMSKVESTVDRQEGQLKVGYVCVGSDRGWCGTVHKRLSSAKDCCTKDAEGYDGYSDRSVYRYANGNIEDLDI